VSRRPKIIDAKFEVVREPRVGQRHATRRGWYFTGKYDHNGDPLFVVWWLLLMEAIGGSLAVIFGVAAIALGSLVALGFVVGGAYELYQAIKPAADASLPRD